MIRGHGGNIYEAAAVAGCRPTDILDMSSNVNPLGPPPGLDRFLRERIGTVHALPEADAAGCCRAFARRHRLAAEQVLAANGTTQFIYTLPGALSAKRALVPAPTYSDYEDACRRAGVSVDRLALSPSAGFVPNPEQLERRLAAVDLAFICNPNNPTGVWLPADALEALCRAHPSVRFVVDESYLPFVEGAEEKSLAGRQIPNAVVLSSLSKVFRIPGLRIGFLVGPEPLLAPMKRHRLPWSVNSLAQAAVAFLMSSSEKIEDFLGRTRRYVRSETARLADRLSACPDLKMVPSSTIFSLLRLPETQTASQIARRLLDSRILIRNCGNFAGLSERYIRISLKRPEENDRLVDRLLAAAAAGAGSAPMNRKGAEPE